MPAQRAQRGKPVADDDDEALRKLEALLDKMFSRTTGQVEHLVASIPGVVSHSFSDAAFEQSEYLGRSFGNAVGEGLKPLEHTMDKHAELVMEMARQQQTMMHEQLRLTESLHRLWVMNFVLAAVLVAAVGLVLVGYAVMGTVAQAGLQPVIVPLPLPAESN